MKISPIFYMGNKRKLIKKGLIDLFPKDIDIFVDLFCGSGIVSMNTKANKYIINDLDKNLISLYYMFKEYDKEDIISHIENRIEEFELPRERTKRNVYMDKEKIEEYKQSYFKFRKYYNDNRDVLDFYTLIFFSFSQITRFNRNGEFNASFGMDCFSEKNKEYIEDGCLFFKKDITILNKHFKEFDLSNLTKDDFIYLDPPYFITNAQYNYNNNWTIDDENSLYLFCEKINSIGLRFGMSNIFYNKGIENTKLIKWCKDNNWKVYEFDNFTYSACGKGNSNSKEVYITNVVN